MRYRRLGKTELLVSEIGLGAEWLERHNATECNYIIDACSDNGINILDCWMSEPNVRTNIGNAIQKNRNKWYVQGHLGSVWLNGQYDRSRDVKLVDVAFKDFMHRFHTDYVDLGMIHYVDSEDAWNKVKDTPFIDYVLDLKRKGIIHYIGFSSHNPEIAIKVVESGLVDMMLFSINPAFDMRPATDDMEQYFATEQYRDSIKRIDSLRTQLYELCDRMDVGITAMKVYAGGRLFDDNLSPFGVALTPVQCIHYALTRPAVSSVLVGYDSPEHVFDAIAYENATDEEKDYAPVIASSGSNIVSGQCTYCGHCRPCLKNIDIAMVNKLCDLAVMHKDVPYLIKEHYYSLDKNANDCVMCGGCETRCPFDVKITSKMKKAREIFGRKE